MCERLEFAKPLLAYESRNRLAFKPYSDNAFKQSTITLPRDGGCLQKTSVLCYEQRDASPSLLFQTG
jgi:hypothetical protein